MASSPPTRTSGDRDRPGVLGIGRGAGVIGADELNACAGGGAIGGGAAGGAAG